MSVKTLKRVEIQDGWVVTVEGRIRIGDPAASSPKDIGITEARLVSTPPQKKRAQLPSQQKKAKKIVHKETSPLPTESGQPLIEEPLMVAPSPLDPPTQSPHEAEERGRIF